MENSHVLSEYSSTRAIWPAAFASDKRVSCTCFSSSSGSFGIVSPQLSHLPSPSSSVCCVQGSSGFSSSPTLSATGSRLKLTVPALGRTTPIVYTPSSNPYSLGTPLSASARYVAFSEEASHSAVSVRGPDSSISQLPESHEEYPSPASTFTWNTASLSTFSNVMYAFPTPTQKVSTPV